MKIPVVKVLVENHTIDELREAEDALIAETTLPFKVGGDDEGEKLTHILAAIFVLERMMHEGIDFKVALRNYTRMVRESIS